MTKTQQQGPAKSSVSGSGVRLLRAFKALSINLNVVISCITEKGYGEHQCSLTVGDEEWQVHPRLPDHPQDPETGKSKAGHFGQQHTTTHVSAASGLCGVLPSAVLVHGVCVLQHKVATGVPQAVSEQCCMCCVISGYSMLSSCSGLPHSLLQEE